MKDSIFGDIKLNFDQSTFSLLYSRHKIYVIPVTLIIVCIFVFFLLVTHQIQDLLFTNNEITQTKDRIRILKENLNKLTMVDQAQQEKQLTLVVNALPIKKDFSGILSAISQASSKTGISVNDYSFQVGDVTKISIENTPAQLSLSLTLQTDALGAARFLHELSTTVPLSNISSVRSSGSLSTVSVGFYYRPLSSTKVDYHAPIQNLSSSDSKLLETISSWQGGF